MTSFKLSTNALKNSLLNVEDIALLVLNIWRGGSCTEIPVHSTFLLFQYGTGTAI